MKLTSLKLAALALASLAALAQTANAQNVSTSTGDLILGVYQTNNAATGYGKTYEVDLGSLQNFNSNSTIDLGSRVSITDLNTIFGGSLSSTSWVVVGSSNTSQFTLNTPSATVFNNAVLITDTNIPGTYSHSGLSGSGVAPTIGGDITTLGQSTQTANSVYASILSENAPNGLTASNNFSIASSGTAVSANIAFANTGNFYLLDPASNLANATRGQTYALGDFQFVGGTDFTFNPQAIQAVPEPSTYALLGLGALVLVLARRRTRASNS
jgi:hypothetical protein